MHDGHDGYTVVVKPPPAHGQEGCSAALFVDALLGLGGARAGAFQETRDQVGVPLVDEASPAQVVERLNGHGKDDLEVPAGDGLRDPLHAAAGHVVRYEHRA